MYALRAREWIFRHCATFLLGSESCEMSAFTREASLFAILFTLLCLLPPPVMLLHRPLSWLPARVN